MRNFSHKAPPLLKQKFIVDKTPFTIHLKNSICSSKLLFPLLYQRMPHLSTNAPSRMVFEHLQDCFHPQNSTSGFLQLFQICFHIFKGLIPLQIARVLGTAHLLAITKLSSKVHPIVVGEVMYRFTNCTLYLQFCDVFVKHFSSNQFEVATKGDCEVVIHGIQCTLDLYPNWVVLQLDMANTFNLVSKKVILQKNCVVGEDIMQLIPFVHASMHLCFPYFTIIIIMKVMSQSSPLPWEPIYVILQEGHYSHQPTLGLCILQLVISFLFNSIHYR